MWELLAVVVRSAVSALRLRRDLALENLALRHQLVVLKRQSKKPRFKDRDRLVWIGMKRIWSGWTEALHLVEPATIVKWHRAGFRYYWRRKSRNRGGRPRIDPQVRKLIRDMWNSNPTWGKPRIQAELAKLGIAVSDSTVAKYRPKRRKPPSPTWRAFLDDHLKDICALDFFTVPTATFRVLYVLVMMSHDRRRILRNLSIDGRLGVSLQPRGAGRASHRDYRDCKAPERSGWREASRPKPDRFRLG